MRKSIIRLIRGSQRGFTLIELLAVMAVIGVLAGIVTTSVSGTGETASVAQAQSDASTVESSAGTFFTDQAATEVLTPKTVDVTAQIASDINLTSAPVTYTGDSTSTPVGGVSYGGDTPDVDTVQEKSSRWPELYITENSDTTTDTSLTVTESVCVESVYCQEFPTNGLHSDGVVISVIVADSDGAAIDRSPLLEGYTAVNFATLVAQGYAASAPDSAEQTAEVDVGDKTINVHNYLWLFKKSTSAGGSGEDDSRSTKVFKLANVKVTEADVETDDSTVTLFYAQIN